MSSRQQRKSSSVQKERGRSSTPQTSTPASASRSRPNVCRSPSPTVRSRYQEKEDLSVLNDRLAQYIGRVRTLENDKSVLVKQVEEQEKTVTREHSSIKHLYEAELSEARRSLDEVSKEKAKLLIEVPVLRKENDELRSKLAAKTAECKSADNRSLSLEGQLAKRTGRVAELEHQVKHFEDAYNAGTRELAALQKQVASLKRDLEEETLRRVELQNRCQTMRETFDFQTSVHEQELNESRTRISTTRIEEVDGAGSADYEAQLAEGLALARQEYEDHMLMYKAEANEGLANIMSTMKDGVDTGKRSAEELKSMTRRYQDISSTVSKLESELGGYKKRVVDLENALENEKTLYDSELANRDIEISRLQHVLKAKLEEYQDLWDIKMTLDAEINAYRKLLEAEEARLGSTPSGTPRRLAMASRKRRGDFQRTTARKTRRTVHFEQTVAGPVSIDSVDDTSRFVKVANSSDKAASLAGWSLKVEGENISSPIVYKFQRTLKIKPGETATVWGHEVAGALHEPPAHFTMKNQAWPTISDHTFTLLNDGDELCSQVKGTQKIETVFEDDVDSGNEGDPEMSRCVVM